MLLLVFLAGCKSGDPRPKIYPAKVVVRDNAVCVLVPAENEEFLVALEVEGTGDAKRLRKYLTATEQPVYLSQNQCVPLYGYWFESGHSYGVSAHLETQASQQTGKPARIFTTSFTVSQQHDKQLQVSPIN
ncbi:putative T6SS immunity periplasmic lipoprotein [Winslowiella toletana]|uniref:putative T6SS immunity periplasmic lipoprotein n=1 Tax=Winslowiella toletana TaxID=92490 RepID=UPI0030B83C2F